MWHNVKQNSDEPCPCCGKPWMDLREGKVTGSTIGSVMANYGKAFGDPAKRLAINIATVELGGHSNESSYKNAHMERGHEEEPIARMMYEDLFFIEVSNGGFFDNFRTGCSTDGNVNDDGIIEIKSQFNSVHYDCIKKGRYPTAYKWQLIFNLKESGRDWVDFISYSSKYVPNKRLYVKRIFTDMVRNEFGMIDTRVGEFFNLIDETKNIMMGSR